MNSLRLYQSVNANSTASSTYTPANGEVVRITQFMAAGIFCSADVKCEVFWDGESELLYAAHGVAIEEYFEGGSHRVIIEKTGDGSKQLKIKLTNDTSQAETIGASVYWV